ncbi:NUDIX hydrolase [Kitasatospora cheerisanensis]|uniref:Nudix hydrolase domain-containing protein n=1 Tax=Kitasatospora cheerisanensis KCTC 2395 TaxID=1348663 RepID=A0A066YKK3_9ACTN|nr:NUDIX hydrolase [Kitasatospora cheerisanensis]KDN80469.1 hypothetical protein KCH_77570 [Kitasatospora cheerisanensis KCTC 2395]
MIETLEPAAFAATLPPHVVSASVLVSDEDGRILMLHKARPYPGHPAWWQLPAGLADAGEHPLAVDYRSAADGWPPVVDFAFAPTRCRRASCRG